MSLGSVPSTQPVVEASQIPLAWLGLTLSSAELFPEPLLKINATKSYLAPALVLWPIAVFGAEDQMYP